MSERPMAQEHVRTRRGRRVAVHTPRFPACACKACWARRWWTPERKQARAEEIRRQYADGRRSWSPAANLKRASHWQAEHDALLRDLVGQHDLRTIAARLSAEFGYPRSESSVSHRIKRLGLFILDHRPYTTVEVARMLGMSRTNLHETWVRTGRLRGDRRRGGPHGMLTYGRAELERCVREHAESLNLARIRDSGLAALARAAMRGRVGLGTVEVERLTGVPHQVQAGFYAAGLVPSARRVRRFGSGAGGCWLIDRSDVDAVRRLAAARTDDIVRRREARREPGSGRFLPSGLAV